MTLSEQAAALTRHLWRGGQYAYWWQSAGKRSTWFETTRPAALPSDRNLYFGVHPTAQPMGQFDRSTKRTVCALNALVAEVDAKDHGGDMGAALAHVEHMRMPPSVCVISGGGYHLYWFLLDTVFITDDNRAELVRLQH